MVLACPATHLGSLLICLVSLVDDGCEGLLQIEDHLDMCSYDSQAELHRIGIKHISLVVPAVAKAGRVMFLEYMREYIRHRCGCA